MKRVLALASLAVCGAQAVETSTSTGSVSGTGTSTGSGTQTGSTTNSLTGSGTGTSSRSSVATASRTRSSTATASATCGVPGHGAPFPPTYSVPGTSVFNAFYQLIELVSSTYPFTAGAHSGGSGYPFRRLNEEGDSENEAKLRRMESALNDGSKSLYTRGRDAAKMMSDLIVHAAAQQQQRQTAGFGAADDGTGDHAARKLVGGAPIKNAASPAALFCDLETHTTAERVQAGWSIYTTRRRRLNSAHAPVEAGMDSAPQSIIAEDPALHPHLMPRLLSEAHSREVSEALESSGTDRQLYDGLSNTTTSTPPFEYLIGWPFVRYVVEEWCTLARFQPQVLAAFGFANPKTLFIPDLYAYLQLNEREYGV